MNKKDTVTKVTLELVSNDGITRSVSTNYLPSEIANHISRILSDWKNNTIGTVSEIEEFNKDVQLFVKQSKGSMPKPPTNYNIDVHKEIYKFLDTISEGCGKTVTEYHVSVALDLMKQMVLYNMVLKGENVCDICGSIIDGMNPPVKMGCLRCNWTSD